MSNIDLRIGDIFKKIFERCDLVIFDKIKHRQLESK